MIVRRNEAQKDRRLLLLRPERGLQLLQAFAHAELRRPGVEGRLVKQEAAEAANFIIIWLLELFVLLRLEVFLQLRHVEGAGVVLLPLAVLADGILGDVVKLRLGLSVDVLILFSLLLLLLLVALLFLGVLLLLPL